MEGGNIVGGLRTQCVVVEIYELLDSSVGFSREVL